MNLKSVFSEFPFLSDPWETVIHLGFASLEADSEINNFLLKAF